MDYFKAKNTVWAYLRDRQITQGEFMLLLYLIERKNQQRWPDVFTCPTALCIAELNMSKPTFIKHRLSLLEKGYLSYEEASNQHSSTSYSITFRGHGEGKEILPANGSAGKKTLPTNREKQHLVGKEILPAPHYNRKTKLNCTKVPPKSPKGEELVFPGCLDCEQFREKWAEYVRWRRKARHPALNNETVKKRFEKYEAWGLGDAVEALENSMSQGWQGVFRPKASNGKPKLDPGYTPGKDGW